MDPNNDRYGTYVKRRGDTIIKVYDYCVRSLFMNTEIKVACTLFADNSIAFWDSNFFALSMMENENIVDTVCILKSHIIIAEHVDETQYRLRSLSFFLETDTVVFTSQTEIIAIYPTVMGTYGFLAVTNTGTIIFFSSENESWKVESTLLLNTYVVCCDKTDSKLFLYTRNGKVLTMDLRTGSQRVYSTNVADGISVHGFSVQQKEYAVVVGKKSLIEVIDLSTERTITETIGSNYEYTHSCVCILRDGDPLLVLAGTYFNRISMSCVSLPELEKRGLLQKTGPLVSGVYSLHGFSEEYSLLACYTYGTVTPMLLEY
ncbi:hypothetical protein AV274_0697 [Blastocystis sp. ATCC 50177/Nand II]|uniref:Uncharacterized protein n=1 Tax=Blastocystis sp. subtype 1 (strain ATCC 50177 / NandII) TaxID=478820 RepID=A0A196SKI6_BLAHN|nr:hypothetical protein AV274_0697 [Blastocystis sp. ATCC 50177/Nand II]